MAKNHPLTIVVAVDFEADGELALDESIHIAGRDTENEIHVVYVDPELAMSVVAGVETPGVSDLAARSRKALDQLGALCTARIEQALMLDPWLRFKRAVTHFRVGDPAREIVQLAVDLDADLVVVGTHSRKGLKRFFLGSVAESVAHMARCAVQIARPKNHEDVAVPEIEPPCPKCVTTRDSSGGSDLWCEQHKLARFHPRTHRYSYTWGSAEPGTPTDTMGGHTVQ